MAHILLEKNVVVNFIYIIMWYTYIRPYIKERVYNIRHKKTAFAGWLSATMTKRVHYNIIIIMCHVYITYKKEIIIEYYS